MKTSPAQSTTLLDTAMLALFVLLGLAVRLQLLWLTKSVIDSDEAIVGLMAKHITEGRPWPIFYYGQNYMGSLEAILAAASFGILGRSNFALKLVPLIFSLFHIVLVYLLAARLGGKTAARIAALLAALGPSALILWSIMARGGFMEIVVIGSLSLLISVDLLSKRREANILNFSLLGLLFGLGWWVNNQIVFYIAAVFCVFAAVFPLRLGLRRCFCLGFAATCAFFAGGFPFWYANIFLTPRLATFRELLGQKAVTGFADHFSGFFTEALPIIYGARQFWSEKDIFPHASTLALTLHGLVFVGCLVLALRSKAACRTGLITAPSAALALLLLFFAAVCLIFSASSFGWLSKAPRYVLPLYSVIFVLTGVLSAALLESRSLLKRSAAVCLPLLLLGLQLASQFWPHVPIPGQPFIFRGQRVMTDHRPLYEWLRSNNYRHIRTNYWVGYRTAFETNEEITFTRFGTPRSLRLPDYERHDSMDDFRGVYVLSPLQAALVINSFNKFGLTYRRSDVGGYTIIDQIRPVYEHGPRIDLFPEQFSASSRLDWIPGLLDGDPKTRWGSGTAQHPGMYVEIAFGSPTPVSGLEMRLGDYPQDAPRRLLIQGLRADGIWQDLLDSQGTFYDLNNTELNELPRTWQLYHPPSCFSKVRLVQQGTVEVLDWSIADLMLYSAEGIACSTP